MKRHVATLALAVALTVVTASAWAYWSAGSIAGGNGAASASSVNQGATPTASAAGNAVTVSWAPTTLTTGQAVSGYTVKRYSGSTAQTILTACTGTIAATSCVENNVPTGVWTYSVTPVFATNWVGLESAKSSNVVVGNVAPVAVANSYSVAEDAVLTVPASGVLGNDSDANSDPLTAILASGVANGALTLNANGGFAYTPNSHFNGSDSFSYKANDGTQDSNIVTVTLTVTAVNDAPVNAVPGPQQTPKNTNRVFSSANNNPISISDGDAGGGTVQVQLTATNGTVTLPVLTGLTFSVGDGTSDATMTFSGTIANTNLRLGGATFIPTNNFSGAATLQIVTSDLGNTGSGGTKTDSDTITITVNSLGIFTTAVDIGLPGLSGSSTYSAGTYTVIGSGGDIWGNADQFHYLYRDLTGDGRLTAKIVSELPAGTHVGAKASVMFRETTAAGSKHAMMNIMQTNGSESLRRIATDGVTANDGTAVAVVAPYWVRITRVGNVITAQHSPDGVTWTTQGTAQAVSMTSSIEVGLGVTSHDNAKRLTATYDNVALTTPPTAVADAYSVNEDGTLNVAASGVLANDTDPESNALTAVLVSGTTGLTLNANGSFTYVPPANFSGAASFTYKANDGVFDSNTVTVNLAVNPHNEVPSFTKGANQSVSAGSGAQTVAGWATAISPGAGESGQLVDFVVTNDNNPLFSVQPAVSATGTLTYTPAGTTGVATVSVRIHDNGGTANGGSDLSAAQTFTITFTGDTTGPTGGSVDAGGLVGTGSRYATSTTLSLVLAKGTDPSGVATTGNTLLRATSTLTNGTCGTFGTYTLITGGTDPVSPKTDTVADQACYSYRYVVRDTLGNSTTYTSPDIKVDLTAPAAPSLAFSVFTNTWWTGSGTTVYYRSAASSGSFTVTASSSDTASGVASYSYPALGTNWTSTPGSPGVTAYSWSGVPAAPGTKNVTATNNASLTSANAPFTMTADDIAPTAGTVSYSDGSTTGTTVSVSFTTGTDAGSGVGTRLLQRASAPLTGTTCGAYGGFATITNGTNPTSPVTDTIAPASCYRYQYVVADRVGNQHIATNGNVAHTAFGAHWTFDQGSGTTATDSTGNGNTATLQTGATWTAGKIGANALDLNGTTGFASTAAPVIDTSKSYTVAAWVRPSSITGSNKTVVALDGGSISPFYVQISGGQYRFELRGSDSTVSSSTIATGAAAAVGTWAHLAAVHDDAANTVSFYVDGVLRSTVAFNSPWTANGATAVGRAKWNGANVDFLSGAIDDVRLYDRALSASEVGDLTPPTSYVDTVNGTAGLLSYYRLGENAISSDAMTGTAGATLQSRSGEINASWTRLTSSNGDAVLTNTGRVRKNGPSSVAKYLISTSPASADYTVEADLFVASHLAGDMIGLVGRADPNDSDTYYLMRYEQANSAWSLFRIANNSWSWVGGASQTLTPGSTYRLALDMKGTTIRMLVDGVVIASVTNSDIGGPGRAGIIFGGGGTTTDTDGAGYHLDNFRVSPALPLVDSKGTNHGDWFGGAVLGIAGAIAGDPNTAASFDGINDFGSVTRQIADDFSIEFWFKSTQGISTGTQWWEGAGLVDGEVGGGTNDFGVSLRSDGKVLAGVGTPTSPSSRRRVATTTAPGTTWSSPARDPPER